MKSKASATTALIVCSMIFLLLTRAILFSSLSGDGAIFFALGRFILNGGIPYRNLFETKPPGVFFLSSLSLLFGGVGAAQFFVCLALLVVFAVPIALDSERGPFIGLLCILLMLSEGIGFYSEVFGAAALCLYVLVVKSNLMNLWKMILGSLFLYLAILFKEPFILIALALAILLFNWEHFWWLYVVPQIVALVLFALTLLLLGSFREYVMNYLPFILKIRVGGSPVGAISIFKHLLQFSILFIPLILYALPINKRIIGVLILLGIACYVSNLSGHSGTTAMPVYMAILLFSERKWLLYPIIATALTSSVLWALPVYAMQNPQLMQDQKVAAALDQIMDRCNVKNYYNLGNNNYVFAFTRHSPSGPLLYLEYYMLQNKYLVDTTLQNLKNVDLILFEKKTHALGIEKQYYNLTEKEVTENFQLDPWTCASETINTDRYVLLFRKM